MTARPELDAVAPPVYEHLGPVRSRLRDLGLGVRFAAFGGREGWIRNALTATGIGLGVALLLIAASLPQIMDNRESRLNARAPSGLTASGQVPRSPSSVLWTDATTEYRDSVIGGQLLRPEGDRPSLPPGVDTMPGPGEMLVSPALGELLRSSDGRMLAERLGHRIIGAIGENGLLDPGELVFYAGSSTLTPVNGAGRTDGYGGNGLWDSPVDPTLTALATLISVVLLAPVAVFIGASVRFCGDRRDSRLAALRLVGADAATTRRMAVGEALFGSALGLVLGGAVFAAARPFAGSFRIWGLSAYPSDVVPEPGPALLILLAVPVVSILVTLIALRSVLIEPLGVVRRSATRGRRLWWRLVLPAAGVAVLLAGDRFTGQEPLDTVHPLPLAGGSILVLLGVTALFPWVVDAVVSRLRGGPVSWQLAVRGLQLRGGTAGRAVSGILVAVAGAITLQMVFAGMHDDLRETAGNSAQWSRVDVSAERPSRELAVRMSRDFAKTPGVSEAFALVSSTLRAPDRGAAAPGDPWPSVQVTIADCPVLRKLARIGRCADGDAFVVHNSWSQEANDWSDRAAPKGGRLLLPGDGRGARGWTLPADAPTVTARSSGAAGSEYDGIYATPGSLDPARLSEGATTALITADDKVPDAQDRIRDTASRIDRSLRVWSLRMPERDQMYRSIHVGLLAGTTATMTLIALSMLVSQVEQLRERRRLLPVLMAFGARRSTLARSLLWQTALPVTLGMAVAVASGLLLGSVMLGLIGKPVRDWWLFLPVAGTGIGVILLVTVLSLPALWRLMRPEGLRTE
ncbi:FtsX-like permease family protein [Streptomyces sp. NPDC014894]|uniref:FtsX-like permease family protein n=1 Tax=unclassified Streptomyces TaxID=2593676 RepID=UPI0036FE72B7